MTTNCELAQRRRVRAYRFGREGGYVLVLAEGDLPTPGFRVDIAPSPLKIFPQQYNLLRCPLPGIWPDVVTPYRYAEPVRYPREQDTITVHHADGADQVEIQKLPEELSALESAVDRDGNRPCPPGADEATGFSKNLSFDEAFAQAVANLPPLNSTHPDVLARVEVVEIGGLFGGFAGFHDLFVRICRTHD